MTDVRTGIPEWVCPCVWGEMNPLSPPWGQCRLHGGCRGQGSLCWGLCMHLQWGETRSSSESGGDFGLLILLPLATPATWVTQCHCLKCHYAHLVSASSPSVSLWEDGVISSSEWARAEGTWIPPRHLSLGSQKRLQVPLTPALGKPEQQALPYLQRQTYLGLRNK